MRSSTACGLEISIADLNNDQHLDFFVGVTDISPELIGYKGDGNGNFERIVVPGLPEQTRSIQATDLNQDGNMDFVAAAASSNRIYLFHGNGAMQFSKIGTLTHLPEAWRDQRCQIIVTQQAQVKRWNTPDERLPFLLS